MEKIAFFHMNQLGDLLFSLPLLQAARRQHADALLMSVIRPPLAPLVEATGLVDRVMLKHEGTGAFLRRVAAVRRERFSRAVLISESPESLLTAYCAGVPERCGFGTSSLRFLLTLQTARSGVPSLANNRALADCFGLHECAADYTGLVKVPGKDAEAVRQWCEAKNIDTARLVVVAPGASRRRTEKCWPDGSWIKLLRLMGKKGLVPVLCGAPSEKIALERLAAEVAPRPEVFAAPDGIMSFAALLARARIFTGIDSGAMHLAASLRVPVVALFGATDPGQIGPQPLSRHCVIRRQPVALIRAEEVYDAIAGRIQEQS